MRSHQLYIRTLIVAAATVSVACAGELVVKKNHETLPPAQLGIAPPRIENTIIVSEGQRLDKSLVIHNYNSRQAKNITLTLVDVDKDKNIIKPSKSTLSPWTIINPKTFTIPPNGQQTVRLSIRPPIAFTKKTHYAMLKIQHHVDNAVSVNEDSGEVIVTLGSSYGMPFIIRAK